MAQYKKIKRIVNYVLGPLLFILIANSIYHQLLGDAELASRWQHIRRELARGGDWQIALALALVAVNWGLEAVKWKQLVNHLMPFSFKDAVMSVLAGVSFTMLTPNRVGEFFGRALYMPDGSRIKTAALTSIGSLSQIIVTVSLGLLGLGYFLYQQAGAMQLPVFVTQSAMYLSWTVLMICILIYFNLGWVVRIIEKWPPVSKYAIFIHAIGEIKSLELLKLLALATLRYLVFLLQYLLVAKALDLDMSIVQIAACISTMFLAMAVVPTVALAELGIRGKISLYLFGFFTSNSLVILLVTSVIWVINIILPSLLGSLILLSVKLFSRQSLQQNT